ncbi:MAG: TetR/AcrR family transcriptional regulator C-terminal domain-containing protein [Gordonia sp. (in: high G+C Gram-positive bacteria)]
MGKSVQTGAALGAVITLAILDEKGIDAVTVRAVASRLGIQAPALYYHVRNKQELLDEMGTAIQRQVNAAFVRRAGGQDLRDDFATYANVLRAEYLSHRDGARTFSGTRLTDPEVPRAQEPWLRRGVAAGVPLARIVDAAEVVTAFVVGFVIEEQERRHSDGTDPSRYSVAERDTWLGAEVPLVVETAHVRGGDNERFARQLTMVINGLVLD